MKKFALGLVVVFTVVMGLWAVQASATDLCFAWDANPEPDLAGYKLFGKQGRTSAYDYTAPLWDGPETTCTVAVVGTDWYFVARAYNTYNEESEDSNEVRWPKQTMEKPCLRFCVPLP